MLQDSERSSEVRLSRPNSMKEAKDFEEFPELYKNFNKKSNNLDTQLSSSVFVVCDDKNSTNKSAYMQSLDNLSVLKGKNYDLDPERSVVGPVIRPHKHRVQTFAICVLYLMCAGIITTLVIQNMTSENTPSIPYDPLVEQLYVNTSHIEGQTVLFLETNTKTVTYDKNKGVFTVRKPGVYELIFSVTLNYNTRGAYENHRNLLCLKHSEPGREMCKTVDTRSVDLVSVIDFKENGWFKFEIFNITTIYPVTSQNRLIIKYR